MILNDSQISRFARQGMIRPFTKKLVRHVANNPVLSFGLCSFGYDLRLSPKEFKIFRHVPGKVVDPKCFSPDSLEPAKLHRDEHGRFFILPGRSYGLGGLLNTCICRRISARSAWARVPMRAAASLPTSLPQKPVGKGI